MLWFEKPKICSVLSKDDLVGILKQHFFLVTTFFYVLSKTYHNLFFTSNFSLK